MPVLAGITGGVIPRWSTIISPGRRPHSQRHPPWNSSNETKALKGNQTETFLLHFSWHWLHYNELLVITLPFSLQTQNLQCRLMWGVILHLSYFLLILCMIVYSRVGAMQRGAATSSQPHLSLLICSHEQHLCLLSDWQGSKKISVLPSIYTGRRNGVKRNIQVIFFFGVCLKSNLK